MPAYKAPLRDMKFVYFELHQGEQLSQLPGYEEATPDLIDAVLDEAAKLAENVFLPLNRSGDEEGCVLENGVVRTPAGFKQAYDTFYQGGWGGISCDPQYGGQGLPGALGTLISEMMVSTNWSLAMYPGLTHGAYEAINAHADPALKARYLPALVAGRWSGTMCLTEPQCGTDLGLIRTRATPRNDRSYSLNGTKIFISAGDHDLSENIIHLVLARLPDAPEGIKGISLFLVPKYQVSDDGALGAANGITTGALEHKMGIKGSATCVLNFDDAEGYLVGTPHKGMRAMFTMMNAARLAVGVQGLAVGESAYQGAVAYARERVQGRALALNGAQQPQHNADPLLVHPDVRRMLLTMRAYSEGSRALTQWISQELDIAHHHPDPARRQQADDIASLLTPVVKAFQTDAGFECANLGVQVFGGHGYIREHGMEQLVRDARIAQIYEGTNGIQALDLVGRKVPAHTGRYLRHVFLPIQAFLDRHADSPEMAPFIAPLHKAFGRLQQATLWLAQTGQADPNEAGAASYEYLRLFGFVAMGYMWARMARIALDKQDDGDEAAFYQAKLATARFFMARLLPLSGAAFATLMAGGTTIMDFPDNAF